MADGKPIVQKLKENLAALKAQGAPPERIQEELSYWQGKMDEQSAADPERQRSFLDQAGSSAQTFADAATGGLAGLATDALASGDFAENRRIRSEGKAALNPVLRAGLEIGGALAMPIPGGMIMRGAQGASKLAKLSRLGASMGDAALQAGLTGTTSNLDEASLAGVKRALGKGKQSAVLGGLIAAPLAGVSSLAARGIGRLHGMQSLEDAAWSIKDAMKKIDDINYAVARGEATSTLPIREVLESKTVKPFADIIKNSEKFQHADDATRLMETYKLMSQAQRKAENAIEGSAEHQARQIVSKDDIGLAKGRMLEAAEAPTTAVVPGRARMLPPKTSGTTNPPWETTPLLDRRLETRPAEQVEIAAGIPSLRKAINEHRVKAGELDRFVEGADIGKSVGAGKSLPSEKILSQGKVAFLRAIPKMTKAEAEAALAGVLGRTGEAARITNSPLGAFGLISSAVRLPMQMYRTGPIITALEKQIGRNYHDQGLSDIIRGTTARLIGQENTP